MCGIFGLFNSAPSDEKLDAMEKALHHRGPDGKGRLKRMYSGIGMTRLSILDDRLGHQPFFSANGRVAAVFNGEIYNWRALREELRALGHHFRTECDGEVIPAAWEQWGPEMLQHFRGMFAIALMDGEKLFLARDPVGQKPLYLASLSDGSHAFASEIAGIRAAGHPLNINFTALEHWLALRYVPEPATLLQGIKTLPAGHHFQWQPGKDPKIRRWWKPPSRHGDSNLSDAEALSDLGELVDDCTHQALQSDHPIACYLSSGIDSALLLDSIQRAGGTCETITAGFGDPSGEIEQAALMAGHFGYKHHQVRLDASHLDELPRVIRQMGTPVADGLILAFDALGKATADLGCPVALGGEGPDELFRGYSFQQSLERAKKLGSKGRKVAATWVKHAPQSWLDARTPLPTSIGKAGRQKIQQWLAHYDRSTPWEKGMGLRTLFSPHEIRDLLLEPLWIEPPLAQAPDLIDQHHRQQFIEWLPDWSIIRQDRNAMAHSVEYRMPFLDPAMIHFSGQLQANQKIRGRSGKWIWRELAKARLPRISARRPKEPFYFPLEKFSQSSQWKTLVGDLLSKDKLNEDYIFRAESVERLKQGASTGEFLPLKQLMALVIFQLWKAELN